MHIDRTMYPDFFNDYILYISITKSLSERTIQEYFLDIRLFLKYFRMMHDPNFANESDLQSISIQNLLVEDLNDVTLQTVYDFLYYLSDERENHERARRRKVSALKSFFRYLYHNKQLIDHDPTEQLELPSAKKSLPRYLTLENSLNLLENLNSSDPERDFCILTFFLNCGIRLSELVGLNLTDVNLKECKMRVLGKGNKERVVYLNPACMQALNAYLEVRNQNERSKLEKALFLSKQYKRISKRRVQQIVEHALETAGLSGQGYSTHKLRHTAATLMYQYGNVDALTLKEILGHASTSTTEIYTHLSNQIIRDAANRSPLAHFGEQQEKEKLEENKEKKN